jgi:putative lipoprotein
MRGSRRISTLMCATTLVLAACSRQPEQQPMPSAAPDTTAPSALPSAAVTQQQSAPAQSEPPADSSLAIKRGVAMLAQDRMTFRPCDEKTELWLLDQSDGVLRQTFEGEMQKGPAMLYIEAYGERAPVAEDIAEARAYAGTFVLEEVTYAGVQGQVRGCDQPAATYIVAARGNEPFWGVEVGDNGIVWRQPAEPKEIALGAPQTQDAEGAVRYHASGNGHELELFVDAQTCRDSMSGELFAYSARAVLDGKEFTGCARVGK